MTDASSRSPEAQDCKPDMTPMIDVVFQLLIFFLVSMKFKTLDMRIDAFLPKDRGPNVVTTQLTPPELTVRLLRRHGESFTRVKLANVEIGTLDGPDAETTVARMTASAVRIRRAFADVDGDVSQVRGEIDAGPEVPTGHVVRAIDALIAGEIENVEFAGVPPPGSVLDRLGR